MTKLNWPQAICQLLSERDEDESDLADMIFRLDCVEEFFSGAIGVEFRDRETSVVHATIGRIVDGKQVPTLHQLEVIAFACESTFLTLAFLATPISVIMGLDEKERAAVGTWLAARKTDSS